MEAAIFNNLEKKYKKQQEVFIGCETIYLICLNKIQNIFNVIPPNPTHYRQQQAITNIINMIRNIFINRDRNVNVVTSEFITIINDNMRELSENVKMQLIKLINVLSGKFLKTESDIDSLLISFLIKSGYIMEKLNEGFPESHRIETELNDKLRTINMQYVHGQNFLTTFININNDTINENKNLFREIITLCEKNKKEINTIRKKQSEKIKIETEQKIKNLIDK